MPSESLFSRSVSGPVREATRKALPAERKQGRREEVAARKERQRAQAPAPTRRVGEGRKKYGKRTRAATVAQLDADLAAAPKPPAVEKKAPEAPKAPDIFGLGEGSTMQTEGSVTSYRPKGDPYTYKYDAETASFSVYNPDGTPVRENVSKGMSGYEDFLRHAGGGRTKYHGGSTSAPKAESAPAPEADEPAPDTVVADESATLEAEAGDTSPPVDEPTGADASSPAKYSRGSAPTRSLGPRPAGDTEYNAALATMREEDKSFAGPVEPRRPRIGSESGVSREERLGEIGTLVGADTKVDPRPFLESILGSPDLDAVTDYIMPDGRINRTAVGDAVRREEFSLDDWNFLEKVLKNAGLIAYDAPPTTRITLAAASTQDKGLFPFSEGPVKNPYKRI